MSEGGRLHCFGAGDYWASFYSENNKVEIKVTYGEKLERITGDILHTKPYFNHKYQLHTT